MKNKLKTSIIKNTVTQYISNNIKEYILVILILIIGIFIRNNVHK